jgi:phosphate transport system substrate-binding protein
VRIRMDENSPAIGPSREAVMDGTYQPMSRPVFIYVNAQKLQERPELREFVEYFLTEAQPLIDEVKYVPLPDAAYELARGKLDRGETGTVFEGHSEIGVRIEDLLQRESR